MNTRPTTTRRLAPAILFGLLVASLAAPALAEFPADCPDRDTYRYFPRVPIGSPWCAEETGRMAALAGENVKTLDTGRISMRVVVPGSESDFELGVFDGDTGELSVDGDRHWDLGNTELGYALYFDPNRIGSTAPADLIAIWVGNAPGQPTSAVGENWTAVPDFFPDNFWWNLDCPSPCSLLDGRALGTDGNYYFHLVILYDGAGGPENPNTIAPFRLRGRTSNTQIGFATQQFAFEGALHNVADFEIIYPDWDGVFPPPGSTLWLDFIDADPPQTTYDGKWSFFADLPELASLELFDGDFDYGNASQAGQPLNPSGLLTGSPTLPPCPLGPDTDDIDSFVSPNLEDPPVSFDFPDFVTLEPMTDPEYPVGTDDSLPQRAVLAGGDPTDNVIFDASRRDPCVTYRLIDPTGRVFDNFNPSSQREWEQFRICSQSASPLSPDDCDYIVDDVLLPAGTWTVEIDGMDMSNLNTWFFEAQPAANACLIDVQKTATPDMVTLEDPLGCDDLGKPYELVFVYTGEDCDPSANTQGSKTSCSGDPAGAAPIEIVVTKDQSAVTVSPAGEVVNIGDQVTFTATGNELKSSTEFDIRQGGSTLQSLNVHTSCSAPLNLGDRFGAMTLVGFNGATFIGGTNDVTYTYVVTNNADPVQNVTLEDNKLGTIASGFDLAVGESRTFQVTTQIFQETTNIVTATAETPFGRECQDEATATVLVEGGGGDCVVVGNPTLEIGGRDVKWKLFNEGDETWTIESIELTWPAGNGDLKKVELNGTVFETDVAPDNVLITQFVGDLKDRQLKAGDDKDLKFKFQFDADQTLDYAIVVNMEEGCSIEFTPGGGGECLPSGEGQLTFGSDEVKWKLSNVGDTVFTIESIAIAWPAANGNLKKIELNGKIFETVVPPDNAVITEFIEDLKDRQLKPGDSKDLKFKFDDVVESGDYSILVNMVEGCSVEFTPGGGGGDFACVKPLDALTMIWDGTEPTVSVQAWKDVPGEIDLGFYPGINIGDEVTVTGYAPKDGNDVIWEIFDAGGNKIGESEYHMSCSDDDMDGPEDCGKRQGDGKSNDPGLINDWILEGMVDAVGSFDCTP